MNPSDADFHDRIVIQELIKNVAQTQQLDVAGQKEFKGNYLKGGRVINNNVIQMTRSLERMETNETAH